MFRDFCPLSHELTVPKFGTRFSWLRTAPMSGEEGPSPVRSFLEPLNLVPYRALLKEQGFDDPDDFGNMSASDVDTMAAALSAGGMKPGHVLKLSQRSTS